MSNSRVEIVGVAHPEGPRVVKASRIVRACMAEHEHTATTGDVQSWLEATGFGELPEHLVVLALEAAGYQRDRQGSAVWIPVSPWGEPVPPPEGAAVAALVQEGMSMTGMVHELVRARAKLEAGEAEVDQLRNVLQAIVLQACEAAQIIVELPDEVARDLPQRLRDCIDAATRIGGGA